MITDGVIYRVMDGGRHPFASADDLARDLQTTPDPPPENRPGVRRSARRLAGRLGPPIENGSNLFRMLHNDAYL